MKKTIVELFPTWLIDGCVLKNIESLNLVLPWAVDNIDNTLLDIDYIGRSGDKLSSPLIDKMLNDDEELSSEMFDTLSKLIYQKYIYNWTKQYEVLKMTYNPIHNYDGTETETITSNDTGSMSESENSTKTMGGTITNQGTNNETHTGTTTNVVDENVSHTGTIGESGSNNSQDANNVYGFNSSTPVGDTTSSGSTSSQKTTTNNLDDDTNSTTTLTNNLSDNTTTSNTQTNNLTDTVESANTQTTSQEHNSTRTLEKGGNLGITTTQQMIEAELELRQKNFFDIVFKDIDSIMCLKVYQ